MIGGNRPVALGGTQGVLVEPRTEDGFTWLIDRESAPPRIKMSAANATIGMGPLWITVSSALVAAGLYLTYVGWRPVSGHSEAGADASTTKDLPRAA